MSGIHSIYYYVLNNISRGLNPTLIARRRGYWIFQIFGLFINSMRDRNSPEEHEGVFNACHEVRRGEARAVLT